MPRVSLVYVHDPRVRWSVRASQVARIVAVAEWQAAPALDVVESLGAYPSVRGEARRVLVIRARDREIALLAAGPIEIGDIDPGDVLALPAAFAVVASQVAGIIVAPDASLSLLLEPSAVTTSEDSVEDSVSGEELCPRHS
jgi:chemotaxis signal transduction protein